MQNRVIKAGSWPQFTLNILLKTLFCLSTHTHKIYTTSHFGWQRLTCVKMGWQWLNCTQFGWEKLICVCLQPTHISADKRWPKCIMPDPTTLRLTQVFYGWTIKADRRVSWLIQGWPKCFMADQSTLRLTLVFYGWPKYLEMRLIQVYSCWPKRFMADPSTLRLTQVFHC